MRYLRHKLKETLAIAIETIATMSKSPQNICYEEMKLLCTLFIYVFIQNGGYSRLL